MIYYRTVTSRPNSKTTQVLPPSQKFRASSMLLLLTLEIYKYGIGTIRTVDLKV